MMDRSSAEIHNKEEPEDLENYRPLHIGGGFTHFAINATSVILIASVAFCILLFQTDTFVKIDRDTLNKDLQEPRTTVTSVTASVNQNTANIPGVSGQTVGTGYYQYDEAIYQKIMQGNVPHNTESRAKTVAALWTFCKDDYGVFAICGLAGNIYREGKPGEVQHGSTVADWDGPGTVASSTDANPLFVRTANNIHRITTGSLDPVTKKSGVGLMQWTYLPYRQELATFYTKYLPSSGQLSDDDLRAAEIEYIVTVVLPSHPDIKNCTSVYSATEWWQVNYEKNQSTVAPDRVEVAEAMYAAITGGN